MNGYRLTKEGEQLLTFAERIEHETLAIERQLIGVNKLLAGTIRVSVPQTLAPVLLIPIFSEFNKLYPDIEVQVVATNNLQNISQREADVALRVTRSSPPEHLIGRQLGDIEYGVYGEELYLTHYLESPMNERILLWIGEDTNDTRPPWLPDNLTPIKLSMRANDPLITVEAILLGMGVGRLPLLMVKKFPTLVEFPDAPPIPSRPLWLLTHPDLRRTSRVSLFLDFVTNKIRERLHYKMVSTTSTPDH